MATKPSKTAKKPSKGPGNGLTKAQIAEVVRRRKRGDTLEAIAFDLECTAATVSRHARRAGVQVARADGRGRPGKAIAADKARTKRLADSLGAAPASPDDAIEVLDDIRARRLPQIRAAADQALTDGNLTAYRQYLNLEIETAQRIAAARPPTPPKPDDDPLYEGAVDKLIDRVERLVRRYEGSDDDAVG